MKQDTSFDRIAIRYGIMTLVGLVGYFLIMNLLGLIYIVELRIFNLFILTYGIWLALKEYLKQTGDETVYLRTLALGVFTSLTAVIPFALFILFYMQYDTTFMQHIVENEMFGQYLNPFIVSFLIFFEGMISGFFIAFTLMQYLKKSPYKGILKSQ
jgi:hypothetical protein